MSKLTQRKSLEYVKKEYVKTRTLPGSWYLASYRYKFNITHIQPFLKKLKEKKLVGLECSGCNRVFYPPRYVCGSCLIKPDRWVDLRDTARVATFTITYIKDPETGQIQERPVVCIRHDGCDTTHMVQLNPNVDFKDTYIGMPVKAHWKENPEGGLMDIEYYDIVEDKGKDIGLRKD